MKYSLNALGPDQFEDMIRALCVKVIGPGVTVFGDGPDGGREASYSGSFSMTSGEVWSGHTVIQAKFMVTTQSPADNLKWLENEMSKELGRWGNADSKRRQKGRLPDNLIIVSNVSLSSTPSGGIDTANDDLKRFADKHGVPLQNWRVWPEQQVAALLDDARSIRIAYGGFLTPGDVLAQITERLDLHDDDLAEALTAHVVKDMLQAKWVALDAVGRDDSDRVELGRVGVDLPAKAITPHEVRRVRAVDWTIRRADIVQRYRPGRQAPHVLLVGGPGQGKTTLTALLAQAYRIALLNDSSALSGEAQRLHADLSRQLADGQIRVPSNRRWPIRIDLAAFAEAIAGDTEPSLLRYLAKRITSRSPHDITAAQLNRWLGRYPWLLILDGLDEVASAAVREQVLRSVSDFLIDAGSRDADVVVVVTTRPQGYADELDPHDFMRLGLNELTTEQALAYADRLATERHHDDADLREHIRARLDEASSNQMTARLMTTPLQVTIMSRLLERRQRVPQERYALFEEYFETIYNREVNKKGHIATLLEERRNDVAWVHERVALTCQVEAETAEGVSASIERTRLRDFALERLSREGLDDAEAQNIANQIADAALQRLVLLVPHGAGDSVGFEIRSLQEFMAARALTAADSPDVMQRLLPLIPSAHWRNTWLFAAGYLFRHREHSRSSLLGLLREADAQDDLHQLAAPGSDLAGQLVMDGLASRSPQTNRALALHAMERLHLPTGLDWESLASELMLAAQDNQVREAVARDLEKALTVEGAPRATALLMIDIWRNAVGPLGPRARQLASKYSRDDAGPGLDAVKYGFTPEVKRPDLESQSLTQYLTPLLDQGAEAALPVVDLLTSATVSAFRPEANAEPAEKLPGNWMVVTTGIRPEVGDMEKVLGDGPSRENVGRALRRLVDAIPPRDWHIASTVRADVQHWLSHRAVAGSLLETVYP